MKKDHLIVLLTCSILSCNTPAEKAADVKNESTTTATEAAKPAITLPYAASYSSDWAIGNPENVKVVIHSICSTA